MIKRGRVVFFALLLVISFASFVIAADPAAEDSVVKDSAGSEPIADVSKNLSKDLSATAKGFQENTNIALEQNMTLPPALNEIAKIVFGLKSGEEISIQKFVVLVCLFIIAFLFIKQDMAFLPSQEAGMQWIIALVFTFIIGAIGALQIASDFFFGFAGFFEPLRNYKILQLVVSIVILLILFFVFSKIAHLIKKRMNLEKAEKEGEKVAAGMKAVKVIGKEIIEE